MESLIADLEKLNISSGEDRGFLPRGNPQSTVVYTYDPDMERHKAGPDHPERPERTAAIHRHLVSSGVLDLTRNIRGRRATVDDLLEVHTQEHVERILSFASDYRLVHPAGTPEDSETAETVMKTKKKNFGFFLGDQDTYANHYTSDAALLSAGSVLSVVEAIMASTAAGGGTQATSNGRGFCCVRPPGHHCTHCVPSGFCLFNNVALATQHLRRRHGLGRVAIVDWDVHHGNGTQGIFDADPDVLFISTHRFDNKQFFPRSGEVGDLGQGEAKGTKLNIPINNSYNSHDMLYIFQHVVVPALKAFKPEFILVSSGFDACAGDPLGWSEVDPWCYGEMTRILCQVAEELGHGRVALVLEGGYDLDNLASCSEHCIRALLGHAATGAHSEAASSPDSARSVWTARSVPDGRPKTHVVNVVHRLTKLLDDQVSTGAVRIPVAPKSWSLAQTKTKTKTEAQSTRPALLLSGGGHEGALVRCAVHADCVRKTTTVKEAKFYFSLAADTVELELERTADAAEVAKEFEMYAKSVGAVRATLGAWMPRTRKIRVAGQGETHAEVTMQDVTGELKRPCVLDVKMGTTYVNPDDPVARRRRMALKAVNCSAATLGLRLTAGRAADGWTLKKKDAVRMTQERQIVPVLRRFAACHAEPARAFQEIERSLVQLLEDFKKNSAVWFVSSSLLFVLDADDAATPVKIHMIDFAHVHLLDTSGSGDGRDEGYMQGLENLIRLWRRAARGSADEDDEENTQQTSNS